MRICAPAPRRAVLGLAAAGLAGVLVAATGCNDGEPAPAPTTPAPGDATPAPPAGAVADCVVGDWRSTEVDGQVGDDVGRAELGGGAGVMLAVAADGASRLDFTGMDPVTLSGEVAGAELAGQLSYSGQATGTIRTDTGVTSGSWEPEGEVDWSAVRLTLDLTSPIEGRPLDNVPLGEALERLDEATGEAVDVDPLLREGSFRCEQDLLVLSPTEGTDGMSWTLRRA